MRPSRASKTAEQVALSRALESRRSSEERICVDPFAARFLGPRYRMLLFGRPLRTAVERAIESRFAGHHYYVVARTRYIDDFLVEAIGRGAAQLVILGAGYDSRAYRFADRLAGVAVFEVDHPATSTAKRAKVERILGRAPAHVTYVPVDFNRDRLDAQLTRAGYRGDRRTVFVWEGTTPYLTADAVDEVLRFIRAESAPGSAVLFDYVLRGVLDGTCAMRGARREYERMRLTSEPFTFGIDAQEIEPFLSTRGFTDVRDVGADDLTARYFGGARRTCYVKPWWRIVRATTGRQAVM